MYKKSDQIVMQIAGIVFSLKCDVPIKSTRLENAYGSFFCNEEPEIFIHASYNGLPQIALCDEDKVFDSEKTWRYYNLPSGENIFVLHPPVDGPTPRRIAVFDSDLLKGKVYHRISNLMRPTDGRLPNPLAFPLFEILLICLLSKGRGLLVHACGIDDKGKGYLFAGNSTHGKTTVARLWERHGIVLNDDRIILRYQEGRFWMFGTPFHGEHPQVSSRGVPLDKVFFLAHADNNIVKRKTGVIASSMLLSRSFLSLWDSEGMNFTLDFCNQLISGIPFYELGFVPNHNIVDFIRCVN
jgi:hypothetical protein